MSIGLDFSAPGAVPSTREHDSYRVPAPMAGDVLRRALRSAFDTPAEDAAGFDDMLRRLGRVPYR